MYKVSWILLILIPIAWGSTLPMTADLGDRGIPTEMTVFIRFAITAVLLIPIAGKRILAQTWKTAITGLIVGAFLAGGYIFQFASTEYMSSSYIAVIGSFNIIIVPLMTLIVFKVKVHKFVLLAVPFAVTGSIIAGLGETGQISMIGLILASLATITYAIQTTINGNVSTGTSMRAFTFFMILAAAIVSGIYVLSLRLINGPTDYEISTNSWIIIIYLTLGCTFFPFFARQLIFKHIEVSRATLVMSTEIIFTVLFSLVYGEDVANVQFIGIGFIVVAIFVSQEAWKAFKTKNNKQNVTIS